jgi:hypothetical protein
LASLGFASLRALRACALPSLACGSLRALRACVPLGSRLLFVLCLQVCVGLAAGCAAGRGGWDARELAASHPQLRAIAGQRLADATPYFRPSIRGDSPGLELLLCRWTVERPIPFSLPRDASEPERALLRRALQAWEGAGLGIRFVEAETADAAIRFRFAAESRSEASTAGLTAADCALGDPPRLERAEIELWRAHLDWRARPVPLSPEELAGSALHELGHALGFQGHVVSGGSVMVRDVEQVRRIGGQVLAGGPLHVPSLRALYALAPGTPVGWIALRAEQLHGWSLLDAAARRAGWGGPAVRVGDRGARIFWRDGRSEVAALQVSDWEEARRAPERLHLHPSPRAAAILRD